MEIKQPHVTLIQGANTEIDIHIALRFSREYIIGKRASRYTGVNRSDSVILSRAYNRKILYEVGRGGEF